MNTFSEFVIGPSAALLGSGLVALGSWYLAIRAAWNRRVITMAVLIGVAISASAIALVILFSS